MTPQLPQEETKRIEKEAHTWARAWQFTSGGLSNYTDIRVGYLAGAIHEAERGRELVVGFAEWMLEEPYRYMDTSDDGTVYWEDGLLKSTHTTAELLDLYILDTQKRKG